MSELPEETRKDKAIAAARALTKGAAGAVPIAGSFLSEFVDLLYRQPIEQRREAWLRDLADALSEVKRRQDDLTPERLAENPEFITVLHRATEVAVRTHQEAKRALLRNAVINAGLPTAPDLDRQLYFLRLVDELSINQVLVLSLYRNPKEWFQRHNQKPAEYNSAGRDEVVKQAYPELAKTPDFSQLVLGDLVSRQLLFGLDAIVSERSIYSGATTPIANDFLDFVAVDSQSSPQ